MLSIPPLTPGVQCFESRLGDFVVSFKAWALGAKVSDPINEGPRALG